MSCHAVAHVLMERRQPLAQISQQIRELALHAAFIHVIVPAAAIDEQHFHADVGLQQLRQSAASSGPAGSSDSPRRFPAGICAWIGFAQQIDRFKCFRARAAQRVIHGLRVHRLKAAFDHLADAGDCAMHLELLQIRQRNRRRAAAQHARQIRPHGHGAKRRSIFFGNSSNRAIQPAVFGRLHAGRAGLHEILRIEMRARRIGRTRGVHNGQVGSCETAARAAPGSDAGRKIRPDRPPHPLPPRLGCGIAIVGRMR